MALLLLQQKSTSSTRSTAVTTKTVSIFWKYLFYNVNGAYCTLLWEKIKGLLLSYPYK